MEGWDQNAYVEPIKRETRDLKAGLQLPTEVSSEGCKYQAGCSPEACT